MTTYDVYFCYKCTFAVPESPIHEGDVTDVCEITEVFVNTCSSSTWVLSISFHQLPNGEPTFISVDRKALNGEWYTLAIFEQEVR